MIDPLRHMSVFSPDAFGQRRIDVIGAGATGSRIVLSLAKLGVENIHVWDFDNVEPHNVPNQAFGLRHIGKPKVKALQEIVKAATGIKVHIHPEKVDGSQQMGEIVFVLTDTMNSRKEIWEKALRFKMGTKLVVETRMGADQGRIYSVNPCRPANIKGYEETFYDDDSAEVSACGASVSVGPTAEFMSGLAVWQMIRWFSIESGKGGDDVLDNEIIFGLRPTIFLAQRFQ